MHLFVCTTSCFNKDSGPDIVAHACNLRYLGDKDWEVPGSRPAQAEKLETISTNKPGIVVHVYNPSYMAGVNRRQAPGKEHEILSEK
jgi:hypothetical protein